MSVPSYQQLSHRDDDQPRGSSWGVFGAEDELGTINFLTPERVVAASRLVSRGVTFNLDVPLGSFDPPVLRQRTAPVHTIFPTTGGCDDKLDGFFLQGATQIDGLRHQKHWAHGFYNGTPDAAVEVGDPRLGVNRWADHGIVGRGVLIDFVRYFEAIKTPYDPMTNTPLSPDDFDEAARLQGVSFQPGDIVLFRTGWLAGAFAQSEEQRLALHTRLDNPGLAQSEKMIEWLWDHNISLIAADNVTVEVFPPLRSSPFWSEDERAGGQRTLSTGMLHRIAIPLLGLPLGELWHLDELAEDCAQDGVWEFLLVAKPLNLIGGCGTPANATAIK
jgi:kynurenine formamidase